MTETATKVKCKLDGAQVHYLPSYLVEKHGMTVEEYLQKYPKAPLESADVAERYAASIKNLRREAPPPPDRLTVDVAGLRLPVNPDVPEEACLPLPSHYRLPTHGQLGKDVRRAVRHFVQRRIHWIWGPTGCGKDALPSALCAWTRTPSALFPVNPDTDITAWFYDKNFAKGETRWVFGELFNALVHGYTSPISGRQIPMTIVLSDFDRASRAQAEALRLVGDSIEGRVKGPRGETYPVLPGTRIIITANTMGGGDASGKSVSANVLDTSILNRIERKLRFHLIDWRDEEPVVRAKYPLFTERYGHMLDKIGNATAALRSAVENEELYGEFSHRDLCTWIGECEDIIDTHDRFGEGPLPRNILSLGFQSYADGLSDVQNKSLAESLVDPYVKGGTLPRGKTAGIKDDPLKF
jgi:MoxR-like ATPase